MELCLLLYLSLFLSLSCKAFLAFSQFRDLRKYNTKMLTTEINIKHMKYDK